MTFLGKPAATTAARRGADTIDRNDDVPVPAGVLPDAIPDTLVAPLPTPARPDPIEMGASPIDHGIPPKAPQRVQPVTGSAWHTYQREFSDASTMHQLAGADAHRVMLKVRNVGPDPAWVGPTDEHTTPTTGFLLAPLDPPLELPAELGAFVSLLPGDTATICVLVSRQVAPNGNDGPAA